MYKYKLGHPYTPTAEHNAVSFARVVKCINRSPQKVRPRQIIVDAIGNHPMQGGANGFFNYLVKRGWLRKVAA